MQQGYFKEKGLRKLLYSVGNESEVAEIGMFPQNLEKAKGTNGALNKEIFLYARADGTLLVGGPYSALKIRDNYDRIVEAFEKSKKSSGRDVESFAKEMRYNLNKIFPPDQKDIDQFCQPVSAE